jgi:amino acid transporter
LKGWDSLGCVAGEVKDGGRTYPIAIMIAMVLITINYAFPGSLVLGGLCFV